MKRGLIFGVLVLFLISSVSATPYYVDCDAASNGDGSFDTPWNNIASVNNYAMQSGDDVYFKVGSTCTLTAWGQKLTVDWDGTPSNQVIIGAYYGNGQFGLNNNPRPVIDGNNVAPTDGTGLVLVALAQDGFEGYVTIENLEIKNSIGYGIWMYGYKWGVSSSMNNFITGCYIQNNYIHHTGLAAGILIRGVQNSFIQDNLVLYCASTYDSGSTIDLYGSQNINYPYMTSYNTVRRNVVGHTGSEGINVRYFANYNTVEYNIVFDSGNVAYYLDSGQYNIYRYNIAYGTSSDRTGYRGKGIHLQNEDHGGSYGKPFDVIGNEVYGNYIGGKNQGISMSNQGSLHEKYVYDNKIHDNIIVDCNKNFDIHHNESWNGNEIYDNYAFIFDEYSVGFVQSNNYNPYGVTWDNNFWNTAVSGNAAYNQNTNNIELVKTTGWRNLVNGDVDVSYFDFVGEQTTECSDTIDNDNDGQTDYPNDAGCTDANDNDETNCGDSVCETGIEFCDVCVPDCKTCPVYEICDNLQALYHFDSDASDSSENSNHGIVSGATYTASGKFNEALNFDGVDDYVSVGSDSLLKPVSSVTACAWTKLSGDGDRDYPQIIGFDTRGYEIDYNEINDKFNFWVYTNDWGTGAETTSTFTASTEWIHVCGTYDGSTPKLYLNGVKQTDGINTGNINYNSDLHIGGTELTGSYYNGTIDDVAIWDRALSSQEINDLYNSGAAITCGTSSTCSSSADTNGDSVVSIGELINYISEWKNGNGFNWRID